MWEALDIGLALGLMVLLAHNFIASVFHKSLHQVVKDMERDDP